MDIIGKQARIGLHFLKESVLQTLFNAQDEGPLQPNEIRKRLGIPKADEPPDRSNTLILGVIFHLQGEGRVQHITEGGRGWKITETEASLLQEPSID